MTTVQKNYRRGFWHIFCPQNARHGRVKRQPALVQRLAARPMPAQPDINEIEQATNRKAAVALGTLGLRVAGGLAFPLLTLLS